MLYVRNRYYDGVVILDLTVRIPNGFYLFGSVASSLLFRNRLQYLHVFRSRVKGYHTTCHIQENQNTIYNSCKRTLWCDNSQLKMHLSHVFLATAASALYSYPESDFHFNLFAQEGQLTVSSGGLTLGGSSSGDEFHIANGILHYNNKETETSGHIAYDHTDRAILVGANSTNLTISPFSITKSHAQPMLAFNSNPIGWFCSSNGTWDVYKNGNSTCPGKAMGRFKALFVHELPGHSVRRPFALETGNLNLYVEGDTVQVVNRSFTKWNIAYGGQLVDIASSRFVTVDSSGKFGLTAINDVGSATTGFAKVDNKLVLDGTNGFRVDNNNGTFSVFSGGNQTINMIDILRG